MAEEFDNKDLNPTLKAWRESAEKQADRPDWFWARQRALVSSQVQQSRPSRMPKLAWAGIAATVAIGVALIAPGSKRVAKNHPVVAVNNVPQVQAQVSDPDLMQQVEETMNSGVPDSLEPASTLQQAMEKAYSSKTATKSKESSK